MGKLFKRNKGYSDEEDEKLEEADDDEIDDDDEDDDDDDEDDDDEDDDDEDDEDDDDEDDDDEDDDDDDDEDDEDEDEEESEEDRRAYRHRRRIRNQIIAYAVVLVIVGALAAGVVVVGKNISNSVKEKRQAEELVKQQEEEQAQEAQNIVIEEPEEIPVPEEEVDYLGEIVESYISEMPIEDKVAGLFVVRPEAITGVGTVTQAGEGTQSALDKYAVGGLVYFSQNIIDKEQLSGMLSGTVPKSRYPIFLAVDEEGGEISRVANSTIEVTKTDDLATIGASGDTAKAYESGATIGNYLKELGFNVDFAPVADLSVEGGILGDRTFGSDAGMVSGMVSSMVGGIEEAGVSACLKHFPGVGDAGEDTHDGRVEITKSLEEMRTSNFIPFKAGIDAGVDFVMVSHVTATSLDGDGNPCSLSSAVITDILRNELGFEGIVITDALDMTAITDYYTSEDAAVMAIKAGADMLLMPEDFEAAYAAVLAAVQDGTISEERINESLRRIYRVKCADKLE